MTDNEELKSKSGDKGEAPSDGQDGCMAKKEADKHTPVLDKFISLWNPGYNWYS